MSTIHYLLDKHGPLLSLKEVAHLLKRAPQGVRVCSYRATPLGRQLQSARVKIGRRVYFAAEKIAEIIDQNQEMESHTPDAHVGQSPHK